MKRRARNDTFPALNIFPLERFSPHFHCHLVLPSRMGVYPFFEDFLFLPRVREEVARFRRGEIKVEK
ncbi:MAG: hypothetical protein PWP04_938 [Candidatus Atribacteria bacterium]|nr:hypothetical protein [Candidatus Atribacteria bacterium]